ncbi:hypothetical protein UlMin_002073 [Ulmus minor]
MEDIWRSWKCSASYRFWFTARSATLDTWTPEQVAFIQLMGNEKANSFWEAELPPNYDRVGIENFIRAKYEDKRWVARDGKPKSPSRGREEKKIGHGYTGSSENSFHERKNVQPPTRKEVVPARRISIPVPPKGPEQVTPVPRLQAVQKVEPVVAKMIQQTPPSTPAVTSSSTPVASPLAPTPPKVDYAIDLFNMLSMDGSNENGSEVASADDNADWVGFQSAQDASTPEKSAPPKPVESNSKPTRTSGIEDLLKDTHAWYRIGFDIDEADLMELGAIVKQHVITSTIPDIQKLTYRTYCTFLFIKSFVNRTKTESPVPQTDSNT